MASARPPVVLHGDDAEPVCEARAKQTPSLGAAVSALLHSSASSDLRYVIGSASPDAASPLATALRTLEAAACGAGGSADVAGCERLIELVLDFAAGKPIAGRRHARASTLLEWMLSHTDLGRGFVAALRGVLDAPSSSPGRARLQLAAATLLSSAAEVELRRRPPAATASATASSASSAASSAGSSAAHRGSWRLTLLPELRRCALGAVRGSPTRLSAAAMDAALLSVGVGCAAAVQRAAAGREGGGGEEHGSRVRVSPLLVREGALLLRCTLEWRAAAAGRPPAAASGLSPAAPPGNSPRRIIPRRRTARPRAPAPRDSTP